MAIICAFVGVEKSFDKPFTVSDCHSSAFSSLCNELRSNGISTLDCDPKFSGYVNEKSKGVFEILDRDEAFIKAKCHRQLKDENQKCERLYSYELTYARTESMDKLFELSNKSIKNYADELKRNSNGKKEI